jgi:hypothetical protein
LKRKIVRKAITVTFYRSHKGFGFDAVQVGQVAVEHDLFPANQVDAAGYAFDGDDGLRRDHVAIRRAAERVSRLLARKHGAGHQAGQSIVNRAAPRRAGYAVAGWTN